MNKRKQSEITLSLFNKIRRSYDVNKIKLKSSKVDQKVNSSKGHVKWSPRITNTLAFSRKPRGSRMTSLINISSSSSGLFRPLRSISCRQSIDTNIQISGEYNSLTQNLIYSDQLPIQPPNIPDHCTMSPKVRIKAP